MAEAQIITSEFAGRHTCDSPEWYTPSRYVEAAREVMGGIDLDPASHEEANLIVRATRFYSEQENGLVQPWYGRVFLNPPGGLVAEFWKKMLTSDMGECVWIGYSLEQLQTLQTQAPSYRQPLSFPFCIPKARIAFIENEAKRLARFAKILGNGKKPNSKSSPSHSNYISYIGPNTDRFGEVFGRFGFVRV